MPWSIAHTELIAIRRRSTLERIKLKAETIPNGEEFDELRDMVTEMRYETYAIASLVDLDTWEKDIFEMVDSGLEEIKQRQLAEKLVSEMTRTR